MCCANFAVHKLTVHLTSDLSVLSYGTFSRIKEHYLDMTLYLYLEKNITKCLNNEIKKHLAEIVMELCH